jgi:hypothetical protein
MYADACIASEISSMTRYYDRLIEYAPVEHDPGRLFGLIDCRSKTRLSAGEALPDLTGEHDRRTAILLNGTRIFHRRSGLLACPAARLAAPRARRRALQPVLAWLYRLAQHCARVNAIDVHQAHGPADGRAARAIVRGRMFAVPLGGWDRC